MAYPRSTVMTTPRPVRRAQALLLALAMAAAATAVAGPVRAAGGDGLRQEANEHRVEGGLQPVVGTPLLDDIADRRAAQMVAAGALEHDMDYVRHRLNASGVCWSGFGEIIAWEAGYPDYSYERTMRLWWRSPMHHDVMMGEAYNAAGGAWDRASDGGHYSVMVFVTLCGNSVANSSVSLLKPTRKYNPDRPMVFREGRYTGYRLSSDGDVLATKTVRFEATHRPTSAGRALVGGRAWLKVSSGPLAGYWVHESSDSFVRGTTTRMGFDPTRQLLVNAGKYTAFRFDWLGGVTREKVLRASWTMKMRTSIKAIISGRPYYLISSGPLEGYWLRSSDNVELP